MYFVELWRYHDITGLPMCWLFEEDKYGRANNFIAIVYNGQDYKLYRGPRKEGMRFVPQIQLFGYDRIGDSGVKLVMMQKGRPYECSIPIISRTTEMFRDNLGQEGALIRRSLSDYDVTFYPTSGVIFVL